MTDSETRFGRRQLLRLAASALALSLAGCDGADQPTPSPTGTATPTVTPTGAQTATETEAETGTETPEGTPTNAELRDAALGFVGRLAAGEYETAREVFAPTIAEPDETHFLGDSPEDSVS